MPQRSLTGSRIRERRLQLAIRQSALAKIVGISPTYLNLIEHNRRRIGGKLLNDLSLALDVDAAVLTQGAETALVESLRGAAAQRPEVVVETDRAENLARRFPGWAALTVDQHRRIAMLEQTVQALTDRLTHDPQLAASMHEVLSVVTAIRSTSAILANTGQVDPEWQARFHRNLYEDSQRLASSSQALVSYLESATDGADETGLRLPQEDLEQWLARQDYHIAGLETGDANAVENVFEAARQVISGSASRLMARAYMTVYAQDAAIMPMPDFQDAMQQTDNDPAALAARFNCDLVAVFRRMAAMPTPDGVGRIGLVECDSSGTLMFRKPVDGFALPRYGASCALWPLFQALTRPTLPVRHVVEQVGHTPQRFLTYAVSNPIAMSGFNRPQVVRATMLILPDDRASVGETADPLLIGTSCRICPRDGCPARREPSVLAVGF